MLRLDIATGLAMEEIEQRLHALEATLPVRLANDVVSETQVRDLVRAERHHFDTATIRGFVPILVERAVTERVRAAQEQHSRSVVRQPHSEHSLGHPPSIDE